MKTDKTKKLTRAVVVLALLADRVQLTEGQKSKLGEITFDF